MPKYQIHRQIYAAGSASLILLAIGYHTGWTSPSLAKLQSPNSDVLITSGQGAWIASFILVGSMGGSIISFVLVDKCGRKLSLLFMAIPSFLSCVLIAVATNHWWFYVARFVAGIAVGSVYSVMPVYLSEIAEDRIRGGLGTLMTVMINLGTLIPYTLGPWMSRVSVAAVGAVIPIIFTLAFAWMPETPYYYAMKNIQYKTEKSLMWLRGSPDVADEVIKIQKNVDFKRKHSASIIELFTVPGNRKAFIISIGLTTCNQFSGNPALLTYSTIIMDVVNAGISSSVVVIIVGVVQLVSSVSVVFLADRVGRRPLLITSVSLCSIFMFGLAVYFQLRANGNNVTNISWLPVVAMIGFFISHTGGIATLPLLMSAEFFPCEVKACAMAVIGAYFCLAGIAVTKSYQIMTDAYGEHLGFYIFAACSALSTIFIFFCVPETKKRSLSDIQEDLKGNTTKPMLSLSDPE